MKYYLFVYILCAIAAVVASEGLLDELKATTARYEAASRRFKKIDVQPQVTVDELSHSETPMASSVATYPQCVSFSFPVAALSYYSTCGNVVNYPYYLPAGVSTTYLENVARGLLNNSGLSLLPNSCQVALKRQVCASVYLKCKPGLNLTDYSTYNFNIYTDVGLTVPVPFQRPCQSLCTNTNTQCLGLLGLLDFDNNCTETFDYSGGLVPKIPRQYDNGNNPNICNNASHAFTIAASSEPYVQGPTGACYGIVDTVYIPPSSAVSSVLAPLLPSYVIQTIIDGQLKTSFAHLPKWVDEECHLALRKHYCRSYLIKPYAVSYGSAFSAGGATAYLPIFTAAGVNVSQVVKNNVIVPSYPSQTICQTYKSACLAFNTLAEQPSPNCSAISTTTGINVKKYPSSTQTILVLPIPLPQPLPTLYIPFASPQDDNAAVTTEAYTTLCPDGFVVPEVPDDDRIQWVHGTGCALACRLPSYTNAQYHFINKMLRGLIILSIVLLIIATIALLTSEDSRKQHFYIVGALALFFTNIGNAVVSSHEAGTVECSNNAVPMSYEDGVGGVCNSVAMSGMFFNGIFISSLCVNMGDYLLRNLGQDTDTVFWKSLQISQIIGTAVILTGVWGGVGAYGYIGQAQICLASLERTLENIYDMPILFMPVGLACIFTLLNYIVLSFRHLRSPSAIAPTVVNTPDASSKNPSIGAKSSGASSSAWKHLVVPGLITLFFAIMYTFFIGYRLLFFDHFDSINNGLTEWAECAFSNFDGTNNWKNICGDAPKDQISFTTTAAWSAISPLQGVIFSLIMLVGRAFGLFFDPAVFNKSGFSAVKSSTAQLVNVKGSMHG